MRSPSKRANLSDCKQQTSRRCGIYCEKTNNFKRTKCVAARSPVFRAEFIREESNSSNPNRIPIHDVDATSFEKFLHFVYTGEQMSTVLANEDLLKLVERYQLETLRNFCRNALREFTDQQMASFVSHLITEADRKQTTESTSFEIK